MALTFDTANLVVESTASISDLPAFHASLRDWEDSEQAAVLPVTHTWKALDLGGGAFLYQADFINGWTLKFPTAGNYTITGNLNASIIPVAGVYVERKTSAAYITTAVGGSGPTADSIAAAVRAELAVELARIDAAITSRLAAGATAAADVRYVNGVQIKGTGVAGNTWGPV